MVPLFITLGLVGHEGIEDVPAMPLSVELLFDQFYNLLLLGFDSCLLLPKPIQLGLSVGYLLSILVHVYEPRKGIFVPNIQKRDEDVAAQIVKGFLVVSWNLPFVIFILFVIETALSV